VFYADHFECRFTLCWCCFVKGDLCGKSEVGMPRFEDEAAQRDLGELSRVYMDELLHCSIKRKLW
jgi:hypothetical protein